MQIVTLLSNILQLHRFYRRESLCYTACSKCTTSKLSGEQCPENIVMKFLIKNTFYPFRKTRVHLWWITVEYFDISGVKEHWRSILSFFKIMFNPFSFIFVGFRALHNGNTRQNTNFSKNCCTQRTQLHIGWKLCKIISDNIISTKSQLQMTYDHNYYCFRILKIWPSLRFHYAVYKFFVFGTKTISGPISVYKIFKVSFPVFIYSIKRCRIQLKG